MTCDVTVAEGALRPGAHVILAVSAHSCHIQHGRLGRIEFHVGPRSLGRCGGTGVLLVFYLGNYSEKLFAERQIHFAVRTLRVMGSAGVGVAEAHPPLGRAWRGARPAVIHVP